MVRVTAGRRRAALALALALTACVMLGGCPDDDTATPDASDSSSTTTETTTEFVTTETTRADTSSDDSTTSTTTDTTTDTTDTTDETTAADACGDGRIGASESCDGDDLGGADCESLGFLGGRLACDACAFDTSECIAANCGDGVVEGDEACDGASLGGETCVAQGFFAGSLQCAADCAAFDTSGCTASLCGNGSIEGAELCDGAALPGDCMSEGFVGGTLACAADCLGYDDSGCFVCGNEEVEGDEACDGEEFGANTCVGLGFVGGRPTCADDCTIASTAGCFGEHTFCALPGAAIGPAPASVGSDVLVPALPGDVIDVDVAVFATHTRVTDLVIAIAHIESGNGALLMDQPCMGGADIAATFDDEAQAAIDCVEPVAVEGTVAATGDLGALAGSVGDAGGTWRLDVTDLAADNGGVLSQWCVTITNDQPTEHRLYVANDAMPNSVSAFEIDGAGGLVDLAGSPYATGSNSAFDHHPDAVVDCGAWIYVANYPAGISGFAVAPDGEISAVAGSPFPTASVVSLACDREGWLFASDFGGTIGRYQIAGDGSLVFVGDTQAAGATLGMTYHAGSNRLFVAGWNAQMNVFDHDGVGDLVPAPGSPFATDGNNHSASVDPSGTLVAAEAFNGVNVFVVADDGSLVAAPGSPFADPTPCETVGLAWSPDGDRLFAGHRSCVPGLVMVYDVENDGALTPVVGAPFATGGDSPVGLAVRSTGRQLFVSHAGDVGTSVLEIAQDGSLAATAGSPFANPVPGGHPWLVLR